MMYICQVIDMTIPIVSLYYAWANVENSVTVSALMEQKGVPFTHLLRIFVPFFIIVFDDIAL